ncbi:MAG TPA: dihydrolipoamide acetyltransferase family protein [Anaerolineae bacterium]
MSTNVVMPQLGESVVEGTVGKWFKKTGDKIAQYEPIMEVVTDKVTTEIPSPAAGTLLQILVSEGTTVQAGTVVAIIGEAGESVAAPAPAPNTIAAPVPTTASPTTPPAPTTPARVAMPSPVPGGNGGARRLTPVVARMISEYNIGDTELKSIQGTGEGGRISKKDIETYVKMRGTAPALAPWEQPGTGELFRPSEEVFGKPARTEPAPAQPTPLAQARPTGAREELVALSPMRKAIADHMVRSKQTAPHVTSIHELDMTRVIAHIKAHEEEFTRQGAKLTYTAYFVEAIVMALQAVPIVNAVYTDQGVLMKHYINVGLAVAIPEGLIVPVIKNADEKNLLGLVRAVNDLAVRAREKKLTPDDVQGATITITNYGIFGSLFGTPVINQPASAILGVGAIQKRVIVTSVPLVGGGTSDAMAIRPMVYVGLTFDHRLLDGEIGDRFMNAFKKHLENYPS